MDEAERRSTERLQLRIPIRVMAFHSSIGSFTEDTYTLEVNRAGARIALKHRVAQDATLRIINLENFYEADFRVLGPMRLSGAEVSEWGVECLESGRNIWGIDFPPPLGSRGSQAGAPLKCLGCGKKSLCLLTLMEVEILNSTGVLERLCDQCGQLSSWMYADHAGRSPESPASESAEPTPPTDRWDGHTERRVHKRLALKLPVLVQNANGEQEVTKTEDVSKGGLAVSLAIKLVVGAIVKVVCPYTAGGQNLEQRAEVRRRVPLVANERWLYGFRYVF